MLEVIFSAPILNDVKKLETHNSNIVSKVDIKTKKVLETETDDRGKHFSDSVKMALNCIKCYRSQQSR